MRVRVAVLACALAGLLAVPAVARADANTGLPGSTCAATDGGARFSAVGRGVTTTGLGADAPAYYEIGAPSGAHAGKPPKGIMLVIHGGGWFLVGKALVAEWGRPMADRWRAAGWQTVNVDYRACGQSVQDVLWFMQRVRSLHPIAVICATGSSAGGHLAMMLAALRQDLGCAISHAGPTDLVTLDGQFTFDNGAFTQAGPRALSNMAIAAFGAPLGQRAQHSPRRHVAAITARVLLATGKTDPLIPREQDAAFARTMRAARPAGYVEVMQLPPGSQPFVHTGVTRQSLKQLRLREEALVAPLVARTFGPKRGRTA